MATELIIAPEAQQDLDDAYAGYESCRVRLGEEFLGSVDACVQGICRMPMMYAIVHENYHRALVRRFPYAIFYEYSDDRVTVYCVFQTTQDPDKWRERLS